MTLDKAEAAMIAKELKQLLLDAVPLSCNLPKVTLPNYDNIPGNLMLISLGLKLGDRVMVDGLKVSAEAAAAEDSGTGLRGGRELAPPSKAARSAWAAGPAERPFRGLSGVLLLLLRSQTSPFLWSGSLPGRPSSAGGHAALLRHD